MKILVTGASGFIGGRFARFALEQGLTVRVNGRRPEAVQHLTKRGAEFVQGDLSDPDLVHRLCRDVEMVVHCAGAVGTWGTYQHFHQANVVVTQNVIEGCLGQQVRRLVHLSSPSVYFDGKAHVGLREEQVPKRFVDHYGATKYLAEQKVMEAQEFGLEVIALRPRFVTGAGDEARAQGDHLQAELLGLHDLLLGQVLGGAVVINETLRYLFFAQTDVGLAIEVHRRRGQMHQTPHLLPEAALDDILGHHHIGLVKVLVSAPGADGTGAVHHHFHITAEPVHQVRVAQVALDEFGTALGQVLHRFRAPPVDPHRQALF